MPKSQFSHRIPSRKPTFDKQREHRSDAQYHGNLVISSPIVFFPPTRNRCVLQETSMTTELGHFSSHGLTSLNSKGMVPGSYTRDSSQEATSDDDSRDPV